MWPTTSKCDFPRECTRFAMPYYLSLIHILQDGHAYATTAHKRFYYTNVSQAGNVLLDTAAMPAGTRITAYIIGELGCMTVAGLTL